MAIRFYFPGQGAQYENMGMDFYESFDSYKKLQEEVALVADLPLLEILKDPDALSETENAQLAIFSMSFGIAKLLSEEGIFADEVMGISLGEYAALAYSGAVRQLDTVKMLKKRSYFMSLAAKEKEGKSISDNLSDQVILFQPYDLRFQVFSLNIQNTFYLYLQIIR